MLYGKLLLYYPIPLMTCTIKFIKLIFIFSNFVNIIYIQIQYHQLSDLF